MKKTISIILICLGLFLVGLGLFFQFNKTNSLETKEKAKEIEEEYEVFFIENAEKKKALFRNDTKQITEFIYDDVDYLSGAIIMKDDKKQDIYNKKGELILSLDIKQEIVDGISVLLYQKDLKNHLVSIDKKKINPKFQEKILVAYSKGAFVLIDDENYYLFSGSEKIAKLKRGESAISLSVNKGLASLNVDKNNYIYDLKTKKLLEKIPSEKNFCYIEKNDRFKVYVSCKEDKKEYKVYIDDRETEVFSAVNCDFFNNEKSLICDFTKENETHRVIETDGHIYLKTKDSFLELYRDSKLIKTFENSEILERNLKTDIFLIKTIDKGEYSYIDLEGNEVFKTKYVWATPFNMSGTAIVGLKENKMFLINKSGKKISKEYDTIGEFTFTEENVVYIASNGKEKILLTQNGKEIYKTNLEINEDFANNKEALFVFVKENEKEIVSAKLGLLFKTKNEIKINNNYIQEISKEEIIYYNLEGKKIIKIKR